MGGVGTGGTITGITRYWRKQGKPLHSIAVEPVQSPVLSQQMSGQPLKPGPHYIQGIGAGFIPDILDLDCVSEVQTVDQQDALTMAHSLASKEGLLCGISSGAAAHVAVQMAKEERFKGKTIVVILPDAGERYLSSVLYSGDEFKTVEQATASPNIL
eukprot:NODE_6688_length_509_cov_11.387435_g6522_i0.p1 GENE.NODE_6688_length_509_cov_11.387435_g6522_i0~~NODE_6688_length_509_cov_11.387435_g6522_i0.p1  ORF type:complete len:157 (-),score=37.09 NODE_6688_length_509_cov_11.387435_g6522_i0:38-508(-)